MILEHSAVAFACNNMGSEWAIITTHKCKIKDIKVAAERNGIYDSTRSISELGTEYAIPVTSAASDLLTCSNGQAIESTAPFTGCRLCNGIICQKSKSQKQKQEKYVTITEIIKQLGLKNGLSEYESVEIASAASQHLSWVRHGDLVVLPRAFFDACLWQRLIMCAGDEVWKAIARICQCSRIVLQEKISDNGYRSPANQLVLGEHGWVSHNDNGVWYEFDSTQSMFSQGNITEKIRMAKLHCEGEIVVDLFAGIGYFTLPILVHAKANHVYACEWNPAAVEGLKRGLERNGVSNRCTVLQGDNRKVAPTGIADRVILGLIPSSEDSWVTACSCIKPNTGGWLHIHGNVTLCGKQSDEIETNVSAETPLNKVLKQWSESTKTTIAKIFNKSSDLVQKHENKLLSWNVVIEHIECVKSYAPHVYHAVVDLHCKPNHYCQL